MMRCWEQDARQRCNFQEPFTNLVVHLASQVKIATLPSLSNQMSCHDRANGGAHDVLGLGVNGLAANLAGRTSYLNPIEVADTDDGAVAIEMETRQSYLEIIADAETDDVQTGDAEMGDDVIDAGYQAPVDYVNEDVVIKRQQRKQPTVALAE